MQDWPNYLIRQDFTELGIMLRDIPLGPLNEADQRLVAQILSESGPTTDAGKWNMDEHATEYSLNGAEVVYNELNHRDLPTFSTYKYALGLRFPERSTGPVGTLYFCWHDPVVEAPAEEPPVETEPVAEE
jgi:hypothetical protein